VPPIKLSWFRITAPGVSAHCVEALGVFFGLIGLKRADGFAAICSQVELRRDRCHCRSSFTVSAVRDFRQIVLEEDR
jgi:hypothetical protein